jgi:hypothetical protein
MSVHIFSCMTDHPDCCRDHACDRCQVCLSGTCCQTVSSGAAAGTVTDDLGVFREAIAQDAASITSLFDLIQIDAFRQLVTGAERVRVSVPVRTSVHPTPPSLDSPRRPQDRPALPAGPMPDPLINQTSTERQANYVPHTDDQ